MKIFQLSREVVSWYLNSPNMLSVLWILIIVAQRTKIYKLKNKIYKLKNKVYSSCQREKREVYYT